MIGGFHDGRRGRHSQSGTSPGGGIGRVTARAFAKEGAHVGHRRLVRSVYDWHDDLSSNALEAHIHNLRKKLGRSLITTVRGVSNKITR